MRVSLNLIRFFIAGGIGLVSAQTSCGATNITSQDDAAKLSGSCSIVNGDIVIEKSATGDIRLDGIKTINGSLRSDGFPSIRSLSSATLETVSGDFNIDGVQDMLSLSFTQLKSIGGDLNLETLSNVENITFSNLTSVANFKLTWAAALVNLDIDKLTNISAQDSSFTLVGAGLSSIYKLYATVSSATFRANDFYALQITNMTITNNLIIVSNPKLDTIFLPDNMTSTTWNTIDISQNRHLNTFGVIYHAMIRQWPWGIKTINNMTFTGNIIGTDFFETGTASGERIDPGIESIGNLEVDSLDIFNCSLLDDLRIKGVIKDRYVCEGKTVAIGGDTKDNSSTSLVSNMAWVLVGLALHMMFMSF